MKEVFLPSLVIKYLINMDFEVFLFPRGEVYYYYEDFIQYQLRSASKIHLYIHAI